MINSGQLLLGTRFRKTRRTLSHDCIAAAREVVAASCVQSTRCNMVKLERKRAFKKSGTTETLCVMLLCWFTVFVSQLSRHLSPLVCSRPAPFVSSPVIKIKVHPHVLRHLPLSAAIWEFYDSLAELLHSKISVLLCCVFFLLFFGSGKMCNKDVLVKYLFSKTKRPSQDGLAIIVLRKCPVAMCQSSRLLKFPIQFSDS